MASRRIAGRMEDQDTKALMGKRLLRFSTNELEDFSDDVLYILDGIDKNNILLTRCLSVIYLANKCMLPEFRKHLKTSNMLGKLFASLEDAPEFHMLGLYTAAAIFTLSQDLEVVDVNEHFLNLLANLLKLKPSLENELIPPYLKIVERSADQLWLKLEQFNNYKCHVKEESNTYQLALDSLLNLPSECFTPWFKHLLHKNGIFGHIIDVIEKLCRSLNYGILEHSDNKLFQFLQILANTSEDEETQHLLLMYEDGKLADSLIKLCQICNEAIVENPIFNSTSSTGISANILLVVLKVLIALTHNYDNKNVNSILTGERVCFLITTCLHILTDVTRHVSNELRTQLMLLANLSCEIQMEFTTKHQTFVLTKLYANASQDLILLTNLVEKNTTNKKLLFETKLPIDPQASFFESNERRSVDVIMSLFYQQISKENILDTAIFDYPGHIATGTGQINMDTRIFSQLEDSCSSMMESLIAAHIGILLGYIIMDNKEYESYLCHWMHENDFKNMLTILENVLGFMKKITQVMNVTDVVFHTSHMIDYYRKLITKKNAEFHLTLTPQSILETKGMDT